MLNIVLSLMAASPSMGQFRERKAGCGNRDEKCCTVEFLSSKPDYVEEYGNFTTDTDDAPNAYRGDEWCWKSDQGCFEGKCIDSKDFDCGEIGEACCSNGELGNYYNYYGSESCIDGICNDGDCVSYDDLPCGGKNDPCCDEDSYSAYIPDCGGALVCFEGSCFSESDSPCGEVGESCCDEYTFGYYGTGDGSCTDNNICENDECVTLEGLPCGEAGEECCDPGIV